jgi:hypothetical protein
MNCMHSQLYKFLYQFATVVSHSFHGINTNELRSSKIIFKQKLQQHTEMKLKPLEGELVWLLLTQQ